MPLVFIDCCFRVFQKSNDEDCQEEDDDVTLEDLNDILNNTEDSEIIFPPHYRCASHTLSRIAVSDCEEEFTNNRFFKTLMTKCRQLWKNQNKTNMVAEKIHEVLGVYLIKPNLTRNNMIKSIISRFLLCIKYKSYAFF